jgi:NAD(P)-dependent dehydrogenase (short-subunit alcohol dehydrogenase family)
MSQAPCAIVTGATSGIGRAAALRLAGDGFAIVAAGRAADALAEVEAEVGRAGAPVATVQVDVTSAEAPARLVDAALSRFGRLDAVVNAAGIIASGPLEQIDDDAWDRMMDINARAPFRLLRAATPHLADRRGAVVNVSSVAGLRAFPGVLAYAVSKAAVDQLTRCAAVELAPRGIRVNAVNPGVVVTELHRRGGMAEEAYAAFLERARETHPLGRPGQPDEVAELILFLATARSAWMTGETIAIDGGRHLTCLR